jgi:hypothetical protein
MKRSGFPVRLCRRFYVQMPQTPLCTDSYRPCASSTTFRDFSDFNSLSHFAKKKKSCFGDDFDAVLCSCDAIHTPYVPLVRTPRSFPSTNFTDNGQSANGIEPHTFTASPLISFPSSHPSAVPRRQWYWQAARFLLSELGEGPERPPSRYGNTDLNGLPTTALQTP